ncbi:MAG TPA: hypothetical protein VD866_17915 [Urbifossiella sp.]|nr:hypothetical protein [Urbifossiella sp.]
MRPVLIAVATICALVVAAAASVYLYTQSSLRNDRIRLREARIELGSAMMAREDRRRELDAQLPPRRPLELIELESEASERLGKDAKWRDLDRKVMNLENEILVILDRWPELR